MGRNSSQYQKLLFSLMPKGRLWNTRETSILGKILYALGEELARVETRGEVLLTEQDVRNASELLTEHETDYGLPDIGDTIAESDADRQNELHSMLLKVGQQYKQYFIDIASALGYTITIEEFTPAWAGNAAAGDACGDQKNIFKWMVWIDIDSVTYSKEVNILKLINKIKASKPAHTHVLFEFKGAEFSRAFDSAFDRIPHYDNSWFNGEFDAAFSKAFTNNVNYDGINYTGAFGHAYSIDYYRRSGGAFTDAFGLGYDRPH